MNILIRKATIEDLKAVQELNYKLFDLEFSNDFDPALNSDGKYRRKIDIK